ncbi:MAG: DUF4870 domain-containing protein [Lactobacillus sp.]|jgi:hypothetical protein|nr:DUF4870 domain-containing protein [Lactobacillus sp.]
MNEHKILRGLSYISVIFAPIIFPLIVWLVSDAGSATRDTAKHALWLHIIPTILSIGVFTIIGGTGLLTGSSLITTGVSGVLMIILAIVDIFLVIYNLYRGIKLLAS